jgi:hypothetical protein
MSLGSRRLHSPDRLLRFVSFVVFCDLIPSQTCKQKVTKETKV